MWKVPFLTFYIFSTSWSYKFSTPDGEQQVQVPLYEELTASLPLVLQNLSNYSGLINDRQSPPSKNITYHFGNLTKDLAMLSDKVSGFYMVLHEMIPEGEGPYLCPIDKPNHIKECLLIATCLLEEHVPEDIDLPTFQSYMEMTQPFLEISWPILKRGLMLEEATPVVDQDKVAPAKYQCDLVKHKTVKPQPEGSFLQESSMEGKAALHLSNRVIQASQESHEILEEHTKFGSSSDSHVDATIVKLHRLWQPVCQELGCDHSNFWDVQLASYRQSTALLQVQSGVAARRAARTEAHQRARLKVRMVQFVDENTPYFRRILNSSSPGRRFFDGSFIQESSRAAFKQYAQRGREAMMRTVMPFMENIANANETRALRLLDQVEFRKFQQRRQRSNGGAEQGEKLQEEQDEESEEEKFQEEDEELEKEQEDQEDQDEQEDEEEDDQLEYSNMTASEVQTPSQAARHRALLSMDMDLLEDESEDEELDGKRRRRRRRRRARRRRWIGGRRRRRRRRRLFKKIVAAVQRAVEDVVAFMAEGLGCLGIGVEFYSIGYGQELTSAVGVGVGLSAGAASTLQQIVEGHPPTAQISLDFGFAVGVASPATWTGLGLGGSVSCNSDGCDAYITVASIASVNLPTGGYNIACPLGSSIGSATCESTYGYGVSTICCSMDLARGSNDCR